MIKKQKQRISKQKEKSFLDKLQYKYVLIGFIIIILALILYFNFVFDKTKFYCNRNPDKCVLEPTKKFLDSNSKPINYNSPKEYCQNHPVNDIPKDYCQLRKKNQDELQVEALIKSCQENPREDEKCKLYCDKGIIQESYSQYPKQLFLCGIETDKCGGGCFNCSKQPEGKCYEIIGKAKSRPKTDWEKHPEDYLVKIKEVFNGEWINNCCQRVDLKVGNENQFYLGSHLCFEADSKYFAFINDINISKCEQTPKMVNQTTYIKKNQCDKGEKPWIVTMDISCDSTGFSPITGFNVTEEDLKFFQDYGYNCSILNEYKNCDLNE